MYTCIWSVICIPLTADSQQYSFIWSFCRHIYMCTYIEFVTKSNQSNRGQPTCQLEWRHEARRSTARAGCCCCCMHICTTGCSLQTSSDSKIIHIYIHIDINIDTYIYRCIYIYRYIYVYHPEPPLDFPRRARYFYGFSHIILLFFLNHPPVRQSF